MNTSTYLRWAGWSVLASVTAMILSMGIMFLAISTGSITAGTHTHSVLVETFDVLATGFLLPLPYGFYRIYKAYAPRLSYWSALVGTITFLGLTIINILFVFEVLWFSDPISQELYAVGGIGITAWLVMIAYLARKSRIPTHGTLVNIIGATIIGIPIWAVTMGFLLITDRLTEQSAPRDTPKPQVSRT